MIPIGGNTTATIQKKTIQHNVIGEPVEIWENIVSLTGYLDLPFTSNQTNMAYNAKMQSSTHIFLCDYNPLEGITSENSRMIINGAIYKMVVIDDPMNMHEHLEIYLNYLGGGLGVSGI